MKRLLLLICFALALSILLPVSASAGPHWPLHRHRKDSKAAKADKPEKVKKSKGHREKSRDKAREQSAREEASGGASPGPRSVGWRYPQPGPAGAGAR